VRPVLRSTLASMIVLLAPGPASAELPSQVFEAVVGRTVVVQSGDELQLAQVLSVTPTMLVVARRPTGEVVTVPRTSVTSLRLRAPTDPATALEPETGRRLGVLLALSPGLVVDAQSGAFYGFGSVSLLLPFLTQTDFTGTTTTHLWAFVVGTGVSLEPFGTSRVRIDAFALVGAMNWAPGGAARLGQPSMSLGVGLGVHYTWPSGLTLAVKLPVLGFDVLDVSSPSTSLGVFFANMAVGLPVLSVGYRF
jgi:hypothetical protein